MVPHDYTEQSNNAVKHAVQFAKIVESDIVFLHVITNIDQKENELSRLENAATEFINKYGVNIECKVEVGDIPKVIKNVAVSLDAFSVIMKTHRPHGKERFTKSRTIKVMMGAKIPFIIVQEAPKRLAIRDIVFPIDFRKENKEKLNWISILSKYYTSKIHLFKAKVVDYRVKNNLEFAKRFLEGKNLSYKIISNNKSNLKPEDAIEYANEINAQLIIIMLNKHITWLKAIRGFSAQKYIANKYNIPVMVLNPNTELYKYEGFN